MREYIDRNVEPYEVTLSAMLEGKDINSLGFRNGTLLHDAAKSNNYALVSMLLDNGADPTIENFSGDTALHLAIKTRSLESIKCFLNTDVPEVFSIKNDFGNTVHQTSADILAESLSFIALAELSKKIRSHFVSKMKVKSDIDLENYLKESVDINTLCRYCLRHKITATDLKSGAIHFALQGLETERYLTEFVQTSIQNESFDLSSAKVTNIKNINCLPADLIGIIASYISCPASELEINFNIASARITSSERDEILLRNHKRMMINKGKSPLVSFQRRPALIFESEKLDRTEGIPPLRLS